MTVRIGVFVCDCGSNISEAIDTASLAEYASRHHDVVRVSIHKLWCSVEGREAMRKEIAEHQLTHVAIAACSPKQHELTFQKVMTAAGRNPFLLQMANIREQIAWVTRDKAQATEKAKAQLNASLERVVRQDPLETPSIECKKDFLVIGAGAAGMAAALALAQKNRTVYLVEREPWIGGKVVSYEDAFPKFECAPCMLEPKMDDVLHHERIKLFCGSSIENIKGFFGNFEVQIRKKARFIDSEKCIACGACFEACPVTVKNKFNGNMTDRHAVYTPFIGVLPNMAAIDREHCLRSKGESCTKCQEGCPFGAVDYEQKDEIITAEVGAIIVATGFDVLPAAAIPGLSPGIPDVYTSYQFERIISSTGPTEGKILTSKGAAPKAIAFLHCAGSRDSRYKSYCSSICCANTVKMTHLARKKMGDEPVEVFELFSDWCLHAKGSQEMLDKVRAEGTHYIRVENPNDLQVAPEGSRIAVRYNGGSVIVDMVVLSTAIVPDPETARLAEQLGLNIDQYGFLAAEHDRMAPAATTTRGIFIAGCAAGPKDIPHSVLHAQAAAGLALSAIVPGETLELEAATSHVDQDRCGGCRVCVPLCPYQAIRFDDEKKASFINEILCKGCGVCVAGCPAGAISNKHFTGEQITSEIKGVLND